MSFLPEGYKVPATGGSYMKFKIGENRFRFLCSPIVGYGWWEDVDGGRKPKRVKKSEGVPVEHAEDMKHFWASVVWNFDDERIQILEITQKGIMLSLSGLSKDNDWGSPVGNRGYDIVVTREGEGLETKYEVRSKPKRELDEGITQLYKDMKINLDALYAGDDPFSTNSTDRAEKIADEVFNKLDK